MFYQVSNIDLNERQYASNFCHQPIDLALFIRFFREKYRLCWKEIYLKFSLISRFYKPEWCDETQTFFKLNELAYNDGNGIKLHKISHSVNGLNQEALDSLARQIQVVDEMHEEKEIEQFMKSTHDTKFIEPQSMNFS